MYPSGTVTDASIVYFGDEPILILDYAAPDRFDKQSADFMVHLSIVHSYFKV